MRAIVVYESWFGNTRAVAEAVAEGIGECGEVELRSVAEEAPSLEDVDLLVVGAPTHVHGLSSAMSRKAAVDEGSDAENGQGVRAWLQALPDGGGRRAAAFDTRVEKPAILVGSAARKVARRLKRHGFDVAPAESFFLAAEASVKGPLKDDELERAAAWGRRLAREAAGAPVGAAR